MKKFFSNVFLPVAVIVLVYMYCGLLLGLIASAALIIFWIYRYLPTIYMSLGHSYYLKDNDKMFDYFEKAYNTGRLTAEQKLNYAYMAMREGRMEKAERLFNAVLAYKQKPDLMARARLNYALFLWKSGNLDEALELTEEVFKDYKSSLSYGNYGYLLMMKGDLDKALEINLEAYEYNDANAVIADNLGQNYYLLGRYEESREIFEKLIASKPQFPIPYYNYAKTLYALGEKTEALENLNTALQYPFSSVAELSRDEVENMIAKIEEELNQ
ncbi:MAG: tetratricopeptide repeat protein [Clostridia bacterium]|nr:tetratricopeptide repeat protein [Clostridia bacterium]